MNDLKSLILKHKSDFESVEKIVMKGYPAIKPILAELLEWIQDLNWPIADNIATFLVSIGMDIIPEIKKILDGRDHIWQYSCLCVVEEIGKDAISIFDKELKRIRDNPTKAEKAE